ncbi:NADPH:quinone reductase-like Zn-dependent oxidoreductase [Williamsia limnetica]|uniref:NADPH:quinone reductase-like Zn-dependent oxidoreductase n=1 Tax=Williamsia limnetica TaxID=882452 RepID=A0A318RMK5_WILLI|nr:zinc-binding dehydrogenase [Williamsia limnetica]PYE12460.1 NADPH:quinone reductase-like Zn-dependent oxidoreductase [Williamsia limnetica]
MKAVVFDAYGSADRLGAAEVPDPAERSGWVTVELRASALNWHDVLVRQGRYGSPLPHVPGADGAGVRVDTGEPVVILPSLFWGTDPAAPGPDFEILGDRTRGTYAELVSVPAECLAPKPSGYSWAQAAALPLVGVTTYRALSTRGQLRPGESVLVIGAGGGIATSALAMARALGANVWVTASNQQKLDRAVASGAEGGVIHSGPQWDGDAKALSPSGRGFDLVLDAVGLWDRSVQTLRPGGRVVVLGANVASTATLDIRHFFFGQFDIRGTTMGSPADLAGLLRLIDGGTLPPPVIDTEFDLADAADAHQHLEAGTGVGKVVLTMN